MAAAIRPSARHSVAAGIGGRSCAPFPARGKQRHRTVSFRLRRGGPDPVTGRGTVRGHPTATAADESKVLAVTPRQILRSVFGHDQFRGSQERIVEHLLRGGHALVVMPTGMGKSLCYQIPALVLAERARSRATAEPPITIVLSPLIALMKDQVDALRSRGVAATFVNSSLSRGERENRYAELAAGRYDLLYVAPERFRKPDFLAVLRQRRVVLLAVDEAHCVSEWGHDFRPDYSRIAEFRERIGRPPTVALTATATPDVRRDIIEQLGLSADRVEEFHEGIDRPNLRLEVVEVFHQDDKLRHILDVCEADGGPGIVYFTLIKTLEEFSERLRQQGIEHLVYHGELERARRRQIQQRFMESADALVLATNAFGMGIDKEDIRFVVHAELPGSMEAYYQEIGRAGRDGKPARCLLLYDQNDLTTQMEFIRWRNPDPEYYRRVFDYLLHEADAVNACGPEWLRQRLHGRQGADHRLETALAMLERFGAIEWSREPFAIRVTGPLPEALVDAERSEEKRQRDLAKLAALVEYVRWPGDRKEFIHRYFGLHDGRKSGPPDMVGGAERGR
ncbi:MAG: ATP-dependent DNA helicase RecQ [Planctomycetota bacterium]|nr:MAG: ATP-dependent DNA helicase RecQ [Planctomycetota bacterium]